MHSAFYHIKDTFFVVIVIKLCVFSVDNIEKFWLSKKNLEIKCEKNQAETDATTLFMHMIFFLLINIVWIFFDGRISWFFSIKDFCVFFSSLKSF